MSLRSFLEEVEKRDEVVHVKERVSPRFEVSSIIKAYDGGQILFFENVDGYHTKVVANICGTRKRLYSALKVRPEQLSQKLIEARRSPIPPRIVNKGSIMDVVEKPRLSKIPVLTHFEKDAGAYITSAIISARSFDERVENVSIHRLLVLDDSHLAIRIVPRHLLKLWEMAKKGKRAIEVAITLGLHPAVLLAATSPVSFGVSEFGIANALLENKLRLIKGENVNAYGPADGEIMLEGLISVEKEVLEGPLVDITGSYDIQRMQPIVEVVNVMHREDYIYQAILPSGTEHKLLMGLPRETMIWEAVAKTVPVVNAVNLSIGGCGWLHAIISIEKQTEGDGKNALMAAFGAHGSLKHAVVVDNDIDIYNPLDVEWAMATRFQGEEDLVIIKNARSSSLDPSSNQKSGLTTKVGFDATRPLFKKREGFEKAQIPLSSNAKRILNSLQRV